MRKYLKFQIISGVVILTGFLIFGPNFVNAATICSYKGPDVSQDLLRLTDFNVSGNSSLKEGDTITVTFNLQNYGQGDLRFGSKGIFVAAREPNNSDVSFGFTRVNSNLKVGETVSINASKVLDKAGSWKVWPSYHLSFVGAPEKFGPNEWHVCTLQVAPSIQDADKDGVPDQQDKCPDKPENYNQYQDDDGCPDEVPKAKDTIAPSITISHTPSEINTASNVTFEATAQDNTSVSKIVIYINGIQVKECSPPDFAQGNWRCAYTGGPYPAGTLTYKAEAFDPDGNKGVSSEGRIEVIVTIQGRPPGISVCSISGRLLGFTYLSKTVKVKFCEAEVLPRTCSPTPPFACIPERTSCKEDGRTWYEEINRVWSGEEVFGSPGPLAYQTQVSCDGVYLIQPVYQPFGEECEWQGTWQPTISNFVNMEGRSEIHYDDYDFSFTPLDLATPRIDVQTGNPSPPATFKGEGNFNLSVSASDPQGIKKIKVNGNYTVYHFRSNETGPLRRPIATYIIPVFSECASSPCDISLPYYRNGKSITFDLRVSACDGAGNKAETSYHRVFPEELGSLTLVSAEPVQVIYGAPLVKNKNTAFRVKVNSTFPHPVETSFRLTLPADKWGLTAGTGRILIGRSPGWTFPDLWGPIKIPANARNYPVMLPIIAEWQRELSGTGRLFDETKMYRGREVAGIFGVDVRLMPVPKADTVNFSVEIDPNNEVRERNERVSRHRFNSPNYTVVKTRPWRFLVVPYRDANGCAPYREFVEAGVKKYLEYLLAVYPIAENKLEYAFETTLHSQECTHDPSLTCEYVKDISDRDIGRDAGRLREWTARSAQANGYDFGIAVGCGRGGQANYNLMAVTVGDSGIDEILAHEFNHAVSPVSDIYSLDCYSSWDESYCELPDGNRFYGCWDRYDEEKRIKREENRVNPMMGCTIDCGYDWNECNSSCCRRRVEAECNRSGGTVYTAPDLRPGTAGMMPAADGFWVNKWLKKEGKQYFMDGPTGDNWMTARSVREEGFHFCPWGDVEVDHDGYLNLLTHSRFASDIDPEALLVSGMIHKNGTVKLDPFIYLPETFLDIEPGTEGDYYFVLLDKDNKVLSKLGFDVYFYQSDPQGGPIDEVGFVYRIEWKEGIKKIELQDKTGKVLASREVSENKPEVKVIFPNGGEVFSQGEKIKIKWQASDKDNDVLTYSLALSRDNGQNWLPVDIDITNNEYELDSLNLEAGDYLVKVRATDGVNSGEDFSDGMFSIRTAEKFPITYILLVGALVVALVIGIIVYRFKLLKKRGVKKR